MNGQFSFNTYFVKIYNILNDDTQSNSKYDLIYFIFNIL